jgi:hypothetical protein
MRVYKLDISDRAAVEDIRATMDKDNLPSIAGIASDAMVLLTDHQINQDLSQRSWRV